MCEVEAPKAWDASEEFARAQDSRDPLAPFRDEFLIPRRSDGGDCRYLCGHSLGLQPKRLRQALLAELDAWERHAVDGHFVGRFPWLRYHEYVRDDLAALVGAKPQEVVAMNSLTVNLHLMMVSFYRPTATRHRILIEQHAFPSDRYAVESQIRFHGFDPETALLQLAPRTGEQTLRPSDMLAFLEQHGGEIALVLLPGVQYYTGQVIDLAAITATAHAQGCRVGFDLAHSAGNVPVDLHASGCDFAVWCSYKYLNSGPGAVAGCFVHERHSENLDLPRFAGWWGHDQKTRFLMGPKFVPSHGADAWQLSNPPILALAPLRISLEIFREAGFERLRAKSEDLTAYLDHLISRELEGRIRIITPRGTRERGCQLSLEVLGEPGSGKRLFDTLTAAGFVPDWREPNVIRVAPVPLYNRFLDVHQLVQTIKAAS